MELDKEKILKELGFEDAFIKELFDLYLKDAAETIGKLEAAITAGDIDAVKSLGHSLKGSSGNLRITEVQQKALAVEMEAKGAKDTQVFLRLLGELKVQQQELEKIVAGW